MDLTRQALLERAAFSRKRAARMHGKTGEFEYLAEAGICEELAEHPAMAELERLRAGLSVLILPSEDTGYERVVLYPSGWSSETAKQRALRAFIAAQTADPLEWTWEDYEPFLLAEGFVIPPWTHGPCWDEQQVDTDV